MPLVFARAAERDLLLIYRHSRREFGLLQAQKYRDRFERAFTLIQTFPAIAPERGEFTPPVRVHPVGSHVVLFRVAGERIEVIRIRHAHEDWLGSA